MNFPLSYPVTMTFKLLALAPQISVRDANDQLLLYVRQKLLKLKEEIHIFADDSRTQQLYSIHADRIIDWSARYTVSNASGQTVGAVKRHGTRSLWRASYDVLDGDRAVFGVQEENPFVKMMDVVFGEIPVIGLFSGYFFNPVYLVNRGDSTVKDGQIVMRMQKRPSFLERNFYIHKVDSGLSPAEEEQILISLLMITLLERARG